MPTQDWHEEIKRILDGAHYFTDALSPNQEAMFRVLIERAFIRGETSGMDRALEIFGMRAAQAAKEMAT